MPRKPMKPIAVTPETYDRLKAHMHPHQALSGVIQELLDFYDKMTTSYTSDKVTSNEVKPDETPNSNP